MRRALIFIALAALFAGQAQAMIFLGVENMSFSPDTTFDDDIFIGGNHIRFESGINGDLIGGSQEMVFAGSSGGNINWASRWITVNGPVDGSIRAFAQDIDINAPIGRNLIAMGQSVIIGPATSVVKDAFLSGASIDFGGRVMGNLTIRGGGVTLAGSVGGDANIEANNFEIKPNTVINGDLIYKNPIKVKIDNSVTIVGETRWIATKAEKKKSKYTAFEPIVVLLTLFLAFNVIYNIFIFIVAILLGNQVMIPIMILAILAGGLVVLGLNRPMAERAVHTLQKRFFVALGLGILITILFPIAAFLALITLVGIPIGLMLVLLFGIFCFAGAIYAAIFIGNLIGKLLKLKGPAAGFLNLIIGIIVVAGFILIPSLGWLIAYLVTAIGLGAFVLSLERFAAKSRLQPPGEES